MTLSNMSLYLFVLLFSPLLQVCLSSHESFIELVASKGDRIFIPCLNSPNVPITFWEIGGSWSPTSQLPPQHSLAHGGIVILNILKEFSGNYSCFTQSENGLVADLVSTVHLKIKETRGESYNHSAFSDVSVHSNSLDLVATEGDTLYVPCLNIEGHDISLWKINGISYSSPPSPLNDLNEGLLIPYISMDRGGSYACHRLIGGGYNTLPISTVRLNVRNVFINESTEEVVVGPSTPGTSQQHLSLVWLNQLVTLRVISPTSSLAQTTSTYLYPSILYPSILSASEDMSEGFTITVLILTLMGALIITLMVMAGCITAILCARQRCFRKKKTQSTPHYDEPQFPEPIYEQVLTSQNTPFPSIGMTDNDAYAHRTRTRRTRNTVHESRIDENINTVTIDTAGDVTVTACPAYRVVGQ